MKLLLKRKDLQKSRHQKYSDGVNTIIGRDLQHYLLTPCNFNIESYRNYFNIAKDSMFGLPVYFRKSYEMNTLLDNKG